MELIVLGRHGRYPARGGANSSYIVRNGDTAILLDMGSGTISRMSEFIGLNDIDAVIFSHLHGDHMSDFLPFNYMIEYKMKRGERKERVNVFLPETPKEKYLSMTSGKESRFVFDTETHGKCVKVGSLDISFFRTKHPVECYAVRISDGSRTLLYTGDTTYFPELCEYFNGVDIALCDACILAKDWSEKSPHISVKDIAEIVKDSGARLLLTHLPDNEAEIKEIEREAGAVYENAELAKEMSIYVV